MNQTELIERLADAEHTRWSHWMSYLFSKCEKQPDGSMLIPSNLVEHWQNEIDTPYSDLTERYKQSDRNQVMRVLPLIKEYKQS